MASDVPLWIDRRASSRFPDVRFLRLKEVVTICGKSRSSIYEAMQKGEFPKPVKLGGRSSAWVKSEIEQWVQARINARKSQ